MRKLIPLLTIITPLIASFVPVEAATVMQSASYIASDSDTNSAARSACFAKAARKALEASGTIVTASTTITTNESSGKVDEKLLQRVKSWVGSVVKITPISVVPSMEEDHLRVSCIAQVSFDPGQIRDLIYKMAEEDRKPVVQQASFSRLETIDEKFKHLRNGMTYDEVIAYMGPPTGIRKMSLETDLLYGNHEVQFLISGGSYLLW